MSFIDYTWLVPLVPILCFLIVGFLGKKMGPKLKYGGYVTIFGAAFAFVMSMLVSYDFFTSPAPSSGSPSVDSTSTSVTTWTPCPA